MSKSRKNWGSTILPKSISTTTPETTMSKDTK